MQLLPVQLLRFPYILDQGDVLVDAPLLLNPAMLSLHLLELVNRVGKPVRPPLVAL